MFANIRPMFKKFAAALALAAALTPVAAQDYDAGRWRLYLSYNDITEIEPTGKDVFVLASGSVYSYNPDDYTVTTYDKTDVLSNIGISHIAWSKDAKRLVIAYDNSNIDLLSRDGAVTNVPDLYMKESTLDKTINSIYIYGRFAYLSTGFGIVKLNAADGSIAESYTLGFAVDYCYIEGNTIHAASKTEGTYSCTLDKNLIDKNNWTRTGEYEARSTDRTNVKDTSKNYWWTKTEDGHLTYYTTDADGNRTYLTEGVSPDGPASNYFYRLFINDGKLYGVSGIWSQELNAQRPGEVHVWDGEKWDEFEKPDDLAANHYYQDPLCLAFDPMKPGHVMMGSKNGMFEFQDYKYVGNYNIYNSGLESPFNTYNYTLVTSVLYNGGDLWVLNPLTENSIKKYTQQTGEWASFFSQKLSDNARYDLSNLFISPSNGMMWFTNNYYYETRLYAYDYVKDSLVSYGPRYVNQYGTQVYPHYLSCAAEDKKGNVWIGTDVGPIYLSAESIRSGSDIFTQYAVPRNDGTNYADYLLANIDIRAIAVDGGNRKWIGTNNNGLFLISDDCNTQVYHFTTENSPLPSDIVQGLAIDGTTGEVFIATNKGLCSFRSDATEPSTEIKKENVYAYPNPVKPGYTGPITIVGLTLNADIKIVTANGTLVNQGTSTGGSYTWDGCDLNGKRVASGVYMVQTATSTGDKGTVCKIAVVN